MIRKYIFLCIIAFSIISCNSPISATTYYISNNGNDSNNGTSISTPWKTIKKINSSKFNPGDSILFKCGDTWREQLIISSSGAGRTIADSTTFITYSSYGKGPKPKILGSEIISNWTSHPDYKNVWKGKKTVSDPINSLSSIASAYFLHNDEDDVTWFVYNPPTLADFDSDYNWKWLNNNIYIYWSGNPNTDFKGLEVAQRERCIFLNDKEFICIDGLECRFGGTRNIGERGAPQNSLDGLIIKNCRISYSGTKGYIDDGKHNGYGISVYHSQMLIKNNEVFGNGRRNINLITQNYGDIIFRDVIVENNICYEGYHGMGISMGINGNSYMKNFHIRNNYIYEDSTETLQSPESEGSNAISILNNKAPNSRVDSIFIYNNVIIWNTNHAIQFYRTRNVFICNNTIYGVNKNLPGYRGLVDGGNNEMITIKNNIFYGTMKRHPGDKFLPAIYFSRGTNTFADVDYNIYYQDDFSKQALLDYRGVEGIKKIIYPNQAGRRPNNWLEYQTREYGADRNSIAQKDPLFVNRFGRYGGDYHLQPNSPAIGAGAPIPFVKTDIEGKKRDENTPTIGAYE